ncbi:hypothetical protein FEM48_Zijuj06G0076200 [Ziziphus jujuba var. spinosa]|uniref:RBR-type E3 ubiquitin transferase n=1 Tax=Ziziphus jujuba var. spinosa TaxID=714518 RepID=A0A978V806_ZIZJJ|nr:hypothetical protein FEM48_Zijuj06G0076200 [Ziziphus jujuba var. spinosa]
MAEYASSDDEERYQYYDDDDDDDDDVDVDGGDGGDEIVSLRSHGCRPAFKIITKESLMAAQKEDLRMVMDVLSLKEHVARTLLIHYRWDAEKLLEVLVEEGKEKLYADVGVTMMEYGKHIMSRFSSVVMCNICIEEVSANEMTTMDCGHFFCNTCWTEHFIVKINDGQSRRIRCMAHQCNAICDEEIVRNLVSARDLNLAVKFDRFLLESYIEDNRKIKWCPSVPHCGNAIRMDDPQFEVECSCGLQFCFSCSSEAHSPCSCQMWEMWAKKCQDESETVNWISVHTKPCPKCRKLVEKNGGCNLVYCICGQTFCWLCGGATGSDHTWTSIAGHSCGRFKDDEKVKVDRAKRETYLVRYLHYYNRYKAHKDSFKLESKLKETMQAKISNLEDKQCICKDFSWVTNGLSRLFRSRQIISYSYPFAYYMFGDLIENDLTKKEKEIKKNLFEDQQQQLEANIEKLSLYIEKPFDQFSNDEVMELRMKIITQSVVVDNLCSKLYECIENELLGSISGETHIIAPYKSKGVEKALELSVCRDMETSNTERNSG